MNITIRKTVITQEIVDRYERKIMRKKNMDMFEWFLNDLNHVEFSSKEVSLNFIKLVSKAKLSNDALKLKVINLFRANIGFPLEVFDEDVAFIAADNSTRILISKELLTKLYGYFRTMFSSVELENREIKLQTNVSKEALQIFKQFVYTRKLEAASIEVYKELLNFSQMIEDADLQADVSNSAHPLFSG